MVRVRIRVRFGFGLGLGLGLWLGHSRVLARCASGLDPQIGGLATKVPKRGPRWSPSGGLGAKPQKPTTGCENNA